PYSTGADHVTIGSVVDEIFLGEAGHLAWRRHQARTWPRLILRDHPIRSRTPPQADALSEPGPAAPSGLLTLQVVEHALEHCRHSFDLVVGQLIEEVATDGLGMAGCGVLDGPPSGFGQPDHQTPSILGALLAGDQAPVLHPAEVMGEATA